MTGLIARLKEVPLAAATNARLKAWLVERDAEATRRYYLKEVNRRGLIVPQGTDLQSALTNRIGARMASLGWPKRFGDLHLFLAYPHCNWEAVLPKALSPFGEVSVFEWRSLGFNDSAPDWLDRRDVMNQALVQAFAVANRRRPVDVVVGYLSGTTADPAILRELAAQGAVITNFCFDDKIRWPGEIRGGRYTSTAGIAHAVDLNLTCDPYGMTRYFAHGGLSAFHAEAADADWYKPLEVPFEYDVSFIGACYGWRPKLFEGLRRRGIHVECFGKGWPNGPISNEDMNCIYARSRINLGCGGIGYSKNLLSLKGRDFEVAMSGALYLTQNNPELSMVFEVGREILTYDDVEDCADVIRAILKDKDRAAEIRAAARARCLKDHTYTARWTGVFRALGALAPSGDPAQTERLGVVPMERRERGEPVCVSAA
jgi:spore maturation protein CgeB